MRWTTDTPSEPGFYWFRYGENQLLEPRVYEVWEAESTTLYTDVRGPLYPRVDEVQGEWSGPLPKPEK